MGEGKNYILGLYADTMSIEIVLVGLGVTYPTMRTPHTPYPARGRDREVGGGWVGYVFGTGQLVAMAPVHCHAPRW